MGSNADVTMASEADRLRKAMELEKNFLDWREQKDEKLKVSEIWAGSVGDEFLGQY